METRDILADPEALPSIRRAEAEIARGEGIEMTKDEAMARWGEHRDETIAEILDEDAEVLRRLGDA
jgi:hypothetical protein